MIDHFELFELFWVVELWLEVGSHHPCFDSPTVFGRVEILEEGVHAACHKDGCIFCPTTDSSFDLRTGEIKEWYPKNPILRALTPPLRTLFVYPVKTDGENIYISMNKILQSDASAEIVFSGKAQPGVTATNVNVDEVRMIIDEKQEGFGFSRKNETINGKAAVIGFLLLLDIELLTGKGLLKGTGFLDFIYSISNALQ
ncbi:hypothetical protein CASFOL_016452 [Castilleja foliolosa]|uniref:Rieske-like [2Fe-2S] domain-containing protein n=1 Tax=Castilleja foliolosa TaxID=1961234 RepID=A0ABD3DKE0_9LAMI